MGTRATGRFSCARISPPLTFGDQTVQLVARLSGWRGAGSWSQQRVGRQDRDQVLGTGAMQSVLAGSYLRLVPTEVIVRRGDGFQALPIVDPTRRAIRAMMTTGVVVALLGLFLPALWRRVR